MRINKFYDTDVDCSVDLEDGIVLNKYYTKNGSLSMIYHSKNNRYKGLRMFYCSKLSHSEERQFVYWNGQYQIQ